MDMAAHWQRTSRQTSGLQGTHVPWFPVALVRLGALQRAAREGDARAMAAQGASPKLPRTKALHLQVRRLDTVTRELRKVAGLTPAPSLVRRAIVGFESELAAVRRQFDRRK
jgi:hypothetical protein